MYEALSVHPDVLPELPVSEAFSLTRSVYTADDMYAYARAAIASRDAKIAKLQQGEPVAYQVKSYGSTSHIVVRADVADEYACKMREAGARNVEVHPLYTSPPPAQPAQTEPSAEDRAEAFIQAAISNAPDPLRKLGEFLTRVLDEDQWPTAERFLLAIAAQSTRLTDREIYNEYWAGGIYARNEGISK